MPENWAGFQPGMFPARNCSPRARAKLGSYEFIDGLAAIPPAQRSTMSLKDAMIRVLQKKYPCKR